MIVISVLYSTEHDFKVAQYSTKTGTNTEQLFFQFLNGCKYNAKDLVTMSYQFVLFTLVHPLSYILFQPFFALVCTPIPKPAHLDMPTSVCSNGSFSLTSQEQLQFGSHNKKLFRTFKTESISSHLCNSTKYLMLLPNTQCKTQYKMDL